MRPQAFQHGEIRDENDNIIQNGAYGKLSAFVNAQNDGILDYLMNNLETLNNAVLGNYLIFPSQAGFPETGDASKVYIDNGTGKPYKWNGTGYTELDQQALQITVQSASLLAAEAKAAASAAKTSETNAAGSASAALVSQKASADSQANSKTSETKAKTSENNAKASESNAKSSENLAKAWAMSESSPDDVDGNKSAKTWAGEAKASASNSASSASASQSSATASASSASDAKVSEANAAKSATAAAQSAENAATWDPNNYTKTLKIKKVDNSGHNVLILLQEVPDYDVYNTHRRGGSFAIYPYVRVGFNYHLGFPPVHCSVSLPYNTIADEGLELWSTHKCFVPLVVRNNTTNTVYWGISARGSACDALIFGAFEHGISIIDTLLSADITDTYEGYTVLKTATVKTLATTDDLPDLTVYATKTELENGFTTASLTVTGETSVPTPAIANNSKTIANTEFVHGVVSDLVNGAPTALNTLQELASALGNDPNFSTTILNKIGEKESKTDAQIEHEKLQNAIDACLESKADMGKNPESNPEIIDIPLKKGMFPISGYPDGFTVADRKYPYSLVVNLQGAGGTLLSLYAQHKRRELYFRVGWPDNRGWGPWNKFVTTDDATELEAKIPTKTSQLTNDSNFVSSDTLKQFWANLLSQNLVFAKALSIATDLSKETGVTKIGSYWICKGQIQQPLLKIDNNETSGGVFYRGEEIATKPYYYTKTETYTKKEVDNKLSPYASFVEPYDIPSANAAANGFFLFTAQDAPYRMPFTQVYDMFGSQFDNRYVAKTEYAKLVLSNGHLSINGSELWIE